MEPMRKTPLVLALSVALAAAPAALATQPCGPGGGHGHPPKHDRGKGHKDTHHLLNACVTADANATGVELGVLSANRHMRDVLDGATTFSAKLDETTRIHLVGKSRFSHEHGSSRKHSKSGSWEDLDAGDVVTVRYRAKRGLDAASMPAAWRVIDHGPFAKKCPVSTTPPPVEEPPAEEPPVEEPPAGEL
jgi:hypothetical protein